MAQVHTPQQKMVGKVPVVNKNRPPPANSQRKSIYCVLCRHYLFKDEEQVHVHSMSHHKQLDMVLGKCSHHRCQACKVFSMGLPEYAQHICTAAHKSQFKRLLCSKFKAIGLERYLSQEDYNKILQRNKQLKKKQKNLNKRKNKQNMATNACATTAPGVAQQNKVASVVVKLDKTKQENTTMGHLKGGNNIVIRNKENKVLALQKAPHQRETARPPDVPTGPPRHHTSVRDQSTRPIPQMRYGTNFSVNGVKMKQQNPHNSTEEGHGLHKPMLPVSSDYERYNRPYDNAVSFTSDHLQGCRGFIFDDMQSESPRSIQREQQGSHRPAPPAPANTSVGGGGVGAASARAVDVNSMLRQIRRALGVREPCRADREAKKQQSEASTDRSPSQKAGGETATSASASASASGQAPRVAKGPRSSVSPAKAKQATSKAPQEAARRSGAAASTHSGKPTSAKPNPNVGHGKVRIAHEPSKSYGRKETRPKPNLTNLLTFSGAKKKGSVMDMYNEMQRRKRDKAKGMPRFGILFSKPAAPTDQGTSTRPQYDDSRLSEGFHWETIPDNPSLSHLTLPVPPKELTYTAAHAHAPAATAHTHASARAAAHAAHAPAHAAYASAHAHAAYASAHTHAYAHAEAPAATAHTHASAYASAHAHTHASAHTHAQAPAATATAHTYAYAPALAATATAAPDSHSEIRSGSRLQTPGAAQQCGTNLTAPVVRVKTEPNQKEEEKNEGWRDNYSSLNKRKHNTDDGFLESSGKKKKTERTNSNKDQDRVDQLLAVSRREDELSHSLQNLDKNLILARNTLQAAYTEVQRLLLLKQQFSTEVDSLRAQRIEILQGIQEVYSESSSNVAEKANTTTTTTTTTTPPPLPPPHAVTPSSNQQTPASSIAQTPLVLPVTSIKQEPCHPPTAGQASQFASSTTDVSPNQPVPLFPHQLLRPSPLATPPPAASTSTLPAAAAAAAAAASTSTPSPELCSRQQEEQKTKPGLKDSVKTEKLVEEKVQQVESDSKEEMRGNLHKVKEEGGGGEMAATEGRVPESDPKAVAPDDGNESDGSVEMVETSDQVVINIDESDGEQSPETASKAPVVINIDESDGEQSPETASNAPVPPETTQTQRPVGAESSSASPASKLTSQQSDTDRKVQPVRDASAAVVCVEDEEPSIGAFSNHCGPIYGLQVHEGVLYTCSGDNTARAYSLTGSRECQAVFDGHTNKVNCLLVSTPPNMPARLYTGSSDETIRCYSLKSKKCLELIPLPDRVFCLHVAWNILYVGLANGSVASYDLKTLKQLDVFDCHRPRAVSCLGSSQEGARRVLLVGSYDSTISIRDAKSGLMLRSLQGHCKTVLCIKVVNDLVFSSSSDAAVHAHNIHTGELLRIYKGHGQAVTSVVVLGRVMVTACLDKLIRVYDLQSHDRLQVYGGHSDMVMCMAVHKSVIYSGCYDGSVQAVKLNLTKNYRCWWQSCCLNFGVEEHLVRHLVGDHSNPNQQIVKCRWKGCDAYFTTKQEVKQKLPEHMQSHVKNDSKVEP